MTSRTTTRTSAHNNLNSRTRGHCHLPTSLMLQRVGGSDSDMSTFDTTKQNGNHDSNATKPRYFVTASADHHAVEVARSPLRKGKRGEATITLADPPRPLSPLTMASSFNCAEETRDCTLQMPPTTSSSRPTLASNIQQANLPLPIPEASPFKITTKLNKTKRGVSTTNLMQQSTSTHSTGATHKKQSTPSPSKRSSSTLLQGLWQKCVTDCYCLSNNHASSKADEPEELDYFQFLPSCAEEEVLAHVVPTLCQQIQTGPAKAKANALARIAQLCERDRAHNRTELVCTQQYNLVPVLCQYVLQDPNVSYQNYRQALLILSNLTLPMENKALLLLGPPREILLQTLLQGLNSQKQLQLEVHLVCAILYNLSFLQDGKTILCHYGGSLDQPHSLIRTLEHIAIHVQPFVAPQGSVASTPAPIAASVERQALRWTFGLLRNLCQDSIENAKTIGQTQIPKIALECVGYSAKLCSASSMGQWKTQSLEDLGLGLLVELALREEECDPLLRCAVLAPALHEANCRHYLEPLLQVQGIHGMRAKAIINRFDVGDMKTSNAFFGSSLGGGLIVNKRDDSPVRQQTPPKRKPNIASV